METEELNSEIRLTSLHIINILNYESVCNSCNSKNYIDYPTIFKYFRCTQNTDNELDTIFRKIDI
jgi:hypothetical protein